jgi:hypothetical protein
MTTTTTPRMPDETIIDPPEVVPGSWLRIIGRFTWAPRATFAMERMASGVCYHAETPTKVREVIETYMGKRDVRLRFHWGDAATGEDWLDEFDVEGYVGCSIGPLRSPLLIANRTSDGGGPILDNCVVRIRFANRAHGGDLYRHPTYRVDPTRLHAKTTDPAEIDRILRRHFA